MASSAIVVGLCIGLPGKCSATVELIVTLVHYVPNSGNVILTPYPHNVAATADFPFTKAPIPTRDADGEVK